MALGDIELFRGGGQRIAPPVRIPGPRRTPLIPPRPPPGAKIFGFTPPATLVPRQPTMIGRPNDERGFIHKKLLGVVSKVSGILPIPGANILSGITGVLAGRGGRPTPPRAGTARVGPIAVAQRQFGTDVKFASEERPSFVSQRGPCDFPNVRDSQGRCRTPTSGEFGGEQFGVGEAVMGRYGAALQPGSMIVDRAVCLRGMQLGNDGLCYNKSQISNKQRMWPAGRKPLLSGGDMRAISTAARAGRRLEGATKRLQRMGMMKKPATRRVGGGSHRRLLEAHVVK